MWRCANFFKPALGCHTQEMDNEELWQHMGPHLLCLARTIVALGASYTVGGHAVGDVGALLACSITLVNIKPLRHDWIPEKHECSVDLSTRGSIWHPDPPRHTACSQRPQDMQHSPAIEVLHIGCISILV